MTAELFDGRTAIAIPRNPDSNAAWHMFRSVHRVRLTMRHFCWVGLANCTSPWPMQVCFTLDSHVWAGNAYAHVGCDMNHES